MDFLRQVMSGVALAWRRLSISARVNILIAALATVAVVIAMVVWSARPEYVRLFDGLNPSDTSKIVDLCQQQKVPYQLENNDQTILVPLKDRSRVKMMASSKNLPSTQGSTPGFELLKNQDLLSNRWLQDVNYMRAVQGELQRQLNEFDFVNKSSVWISEAKEELFTGSQKPSKAVVQLDLSKELTPGSQEVKAILHTIASFGGANLDIDQITLTTTNGTPLHVPKQNDFDTLASSKFEHLANIEKRAQIRAQEALNKLNVRGVVTVSAIVDFDSTTEWSEKSEDGAVTSSKSSTSTPVAASAPRGAPGTYANIPEEMSGQGGVSLSGDKKEETEEEFKPSVTTRQVTNTGGDVRQYLVTAMIDGGSVAKKDANGAETNEYVPLTDEKKKAYEALLQNAVGAGKEKTQVVVSDFQFTSPSAEGAPGTKEAPVGMGWQLQGQAQYITQVVLCIVGLFLARRFLRRAIVAPVRKIEAQQTHELATASAEDVRREEVSAEVARMSQESPEAVVALLRSWMSEEE